MNSWRKRLGDQSYSVKGIALGCVLILLVGGTFSAGMALVPLAGEEHRKEPDVISDIYTRFLFMEYGDLWAYTGIEDEMPAGLESLFIGPEESWLSELATRSGSGDAEPGIRFALGLWKRMHRETAEALSLFHRENNHHPHPLVRRIELETALRHGDPAVLEALLQNPAYAQELDADFRMDMAVESGNWLNALPYYVRSQMALLRPIPLLISALAGGIWSLLILSLLPKRLTIGFGFAALAALFLGVASTWPTVISGIWMDRTFGLEEGSDFLSTLVYMVVSVGVREEVLKLLLFSPLLVLTVRPGKDAEALLLGAFVGLGFAVEENIGYVMGAPGGVGVSRFVSANMMHFMLTGATSLALTRAVRDPRGWGLEALQVLVLAIGLHGIYNALLSQPVPGLGDMSYFHGAALVGCAALFFREIPSLPRVQGTLFSRTALFCWGLCLLFCLELTVATTLYGFRDALGLTGQAALASVFTGYIFLHFIREPLHA
jgi:RsiW-degrading membrane proteinase PrsW (M82 family)